MNCEVNYCIYNNESKCLLESISIDESGMCGECILVSLDSYLLKAEKERHLSDLDRRYVEKQ